MGAGAVVEKGEGTSPWMDEVGSPVVVTQITFVWTVIYICIYVYIYILFKQLL